MRAFVALVPPEPAIEDLDDFLEPRREAADFRWSARDQLHVTLAFAADVPDRALDEWMERLERAAHRRTPFDVALAGGGAFPDPARGRVLWAGLDLGPEAVTELDRLVTGARAATSKSGIDVVGRRFRPHLTLARVRHPQELSNWVRLLDGYRGPAWTADRVTLIASHLGEGPRGRPRYQTMADFALGEA
ncbi:RNA 2',3'-cyclic phosphodiesterase [Nocardioides insulae]|uniref:RNA 2',3'-cyclic phosphodiesterase n=1 Tax=Nocardioides insulae TaxID=394734 RepID=UPI0004111F37|nr:RNA 2',3'-cyclic phosphodiesterase [Nocardioides insulae]